MKAPSVLGTRRVLLIFIAIAASLIWLTVTYWLRALPASTALPPTSINVLSYGAKGDARTDDSAAFAAAIEDATGHELPLEIPRRTYVLNRPLSITQGLIIRSEGAILTHTVDSLPIVSADSVDDWVIQGPLTLVGTRTDFGQVAAESGLFIHNSNRYVIDKLTVRSFRGSGIEIAGGDSTATIRGDQGQFAFISFLNNRVGLRIHNGVGAEYNLFTLLSFSSNETAIENGAGNTIVSTSNIVDNGNGIHLSGGVNAGHGIFSATNINHNQGFNIKATDIEHGYTFTGCHVFGDSETSGVVILKDSQGLHFTGGTLSAAVAQEGNGVNAAADNFTAGASLTATGTGAADFIKALYFDACTYHYSQAENVQSQNARCTRDDPRP